MEYSSWQALWLPNKCPKATKAIDLFILIAIGRFCKSLNSKWPRIGGCNTTADISK